MSRFQMLALAAPLLVLAYLGALAEAQRFAPGYCPTVTAQESFDKTKFFGNWIEVEKTPSIFDLMMRCLVVDYSDDQDNTVNVVVRGVSLAGLPLTVNGDGLLQDVHRSGFYSIRYGFGVPFQGTLTTIIDTDYDDYAVVYSCTNSLLSGVFHSEYIWVLSRSGKISNPTRQNIYEKLDKLQINRSGLTMSDRSTCPANASIVARESDKDLAAGAQSQPLANPSQPASGEAAPSAVNLEKVNGQQTPSESSAPAPAPQKSVVVPLLYDPPSPASSASVGSKPAAANSQKAAPPAPVDNKVPQLPYAPVSKQQQPAKPATPGQASAAPAAGGPGASQQQQQQQPAKPAAASAAASPAQPAADKPAAGSLANKIQPKQQQQ